MVRDRAMRDDVGFGPLPVVSHSGVFDGSGASAGRLACVLAVAGLLCVSSAQGQVIREEGFPVKGGVAEESAWAPVVREECDPFTVPGEFGESCAPREKTPDPFGFGPEGKARPGEPSGPVWRTPPRLECPVAIFLEELETGQVECHAWDASGEEHLEYSWEPVGSTTRDYLDNPRLMPEDVPNPSVVAPEALAYETLESFYSGETTFLYRYRLTATSRATGLSSHEEVEVYVSGSRPSVYCPLEVAVEEGETIALDCEGADPLSHRMDYDENGASIEWEWEGLWGASTLLLDATDRSSALFTAPAGSAGEEYHYIASMMSQASGMPRTARRRVSVRVVGEEEVSGYMLDPGITCSDSPYEVYEGASDLGINCSIHDEPAGNNWVRWSRLGEQIPPPAPEAPTPRLSPWYYEAIFDVPDVVDQNEVYEYTVALYGYGRTAAFNFTMRLLASEDVTITVLNKPSITVTCEDIDDVDEGAAGIEFDCSASGAPGDDPDYTWSWSPTTNLTGHNTATPTFDAPDDVDRNTTWTYTVTASAENAEDGTAEVTVAVRDTDSADPVVTCSDSEVYEGAADITLDCSVANEPTGATYAWTGTDVDRLSGTDGHDPTFSVPGNIDEPGGANKDYEYTVRLSAPGIDDITEAVTVTVLEKPDIWCPGARHSRVATPEGGSGFPIHICFPGWTGAPPGSDYAYAWTARGSTPDTRLLSAANIEIPTFDIPDAVDRTTTYYYTLTVSAENADDASSRFQVVVFDKPDITVTCESPYEVDEGDADIELVCDESGGPTGFTDRRWSWLPTANLTDHDTATPMFAVPDDVDQDTTYTYTVTASAGHHAHDGITEVTVTVLDTDTTTPPSITCSDAEAYEGTDNITLDCTPTNEPTDPTYSWTGTDIADRLTNTGSLTPTFAVPGSVSADTDYDYTVTLSAAGIEQASEDVTVTVLNKPAIAVTCEDIDDVDEGADNIEFDCSASGAPGDDPDYTWSWSPTDNLTGHNTATPTFDAPDDVDRNTTWTYTVTASAENAEDGTAEVTVTVLDTDTGVPSLAVACQAARLTLNSSGIIIAFHTSDTGMFISIWERIPDLNLACEVTDAPENASYVWSWTASTGMTDLALLSDDDISNPVFDVPDIDGDVRHEYIVTATSDVGETGEFLVEITVRERYDILVTCTETAYDVTEGADDFAFDCRSYGGLLPPHFWSWSPTDRLTDHYTGTPTFDAPEDVDRDTTYVYTATITGFYVDAGQATVEVTVRDTDTYPPETPGISCIDPDPVYEGTADITLDCTVTTEPTDPTYSWTGTDIADRLTNTGSLTPTFAVPGSVSADTDYDYTVTLSASGVADVTEDVTVTVLKRPVITVTCTDPGSVYEGSADFALDCAASGAPAGSAYEYAWTARGSTANTDLLSAADIASPTFHVPEEVDEDETYEYLLTVSAENAESASADVTVTVLNKKALGVACATPSPVYEGSEDFSLDCAASGAPAGSDEYAWTARGSTANTDLLVAGADGPAPTFDVPEEVDEDETYEYLLTVSAENAESATAEVTVKVLNLGSIALVCASPPPVYEGSEDFALDCSISGDTGDNVDYAYEWTAIGATPSTSRLSAADIASPTFYVPDALEETTTYEYLLTARAENVEDAKAEVTVTVLNKGALAVVCADPGSVYEGSADIEFDCAASGAPAGSAYEYAWTARGSTANTDLLSAADIATPTFAVPEEVDEDETYEYLLTVSAANAEDATAEVTVTVLNKGALALACADPGSVYEGSADIAFDCEASGAPGGFRLRV